MVSEENGCKPKFQKIVKGNSILHITAKNLLEYQISHENIPYRIFAHLVLAVKELENGEQPKEVIRRHGFVDFGALYVAKIIVAKKEGIEEDNVRYNRTISDLSQQEIDEICYKNQKKVSASELCLKYGLKNKKVVYNVNREIKSKLLNEIKAKLDNINLRDKQTFKSLESIIKKIKTKKKSC